MSTTAIKILALILMTIDHIGEFIPNMPIWFRYIGRLSSMLFFFASAWGFYYTHDKKLYMKRLYKCSLLMCVIDFLIPIFITNSTSNGLNNNIFSSILVADIFIYLIEITKDDMVKRKKYLIKFVLYQLGICFIFSMFSVFITNQQWYIQMSTILAIPELIQSLIPTALCSVIATEGPLYITAILPLIYFSMHDKKKLAKNYIIYNICFFAIIVTQVVPKGFMFLEYHLKGYGFNYNGVNILIEILRFPLYLIGFETYPFSIVDSFFNSMFSQNYQWFMIFALPIMLLYNGKKRQRIKKFILYILSSTYSSALCFRSIIILLKKETPDFKIGSFFLYYYYFNSAPPHSTTAKPFLSKVESSCSSTWIGSSSG